MDDLVHRVEAALARERLLRRGEKVLIAVSGGLDSMVLLNLLAKLAPANHWRLAVAHFNHLLRGKESNRDEALVGKTAKKLGIRFYSGRGEVKRYAFEQGLSIEMAARQLRHEFLAKAASEMKAKTIALAHHADDQVELFFLRLLRGAGTEGLAGMKPKSRSPFCQSVALIRPLLDETKMALAEWAAGAGVEFREDSTNRHLDFVRNRIRHELLPLLAKMQPGIARVALRQMEIARAEAEFIELTAADWAKRREKGTFSKAPVAIQRQIMKQELVRLGFAPSFDLVENLRCKPGRAVCVSQGRWLVCDKSGNVNGSLPGEKVFSRNHCRIVMEGEGGEVCFGGMSLEWKMLGGAGKTGQFLKKPVNCEYFDADKIGSAIVLRHWQAGDRFWPIGLDGPAKVQNLLTNKKLDPAEKRRLVVAENAEGEIFWVEGLRMSERFKLDKDTRRRLKWRWKRL